MAGITSGEFGDTRATPGKTDLTVFMAVPTIYSLLLREYSSRSEAEQQAFSEATSQMRLMVSGSAALPLPTFRA